MYYWTDGTELYHHGIKGQKWGVRRYQNPDGTLTDEGRRRLGRTKSVMSKTAVAGTIGSLAGSAIGWNSGYTKTLYKKMSDGAILQMIEDKVTPGGPRVIARDQIYDILTDRFLKGNYNTVKGVGLLGRTLSMRGYGILNRAFEEGKRLSFFEHQKATDLIQAGQELSAAVGKMVTAGAIKGALVGAIPGAAVAAGAAAVAIYAGTKILAGKKAENMNTSKEKSKGAKK